MKSMQIDCQRIRQYLMDMVAIDSVNPALEAGGAAEGGLTDYVVEQLRDPRIELNVDQVEPGRFNVVARLPGSGGGRSLMLNAHMDTVGIAGMDHALSPVEKDGKIYGRGAYDMKASIAACMGAFQAVLDSGQRPAGDLLLTLVADEEFASLGTQDIVKRYTADAAIVTEPTELQTCIAHKGMFWLQIDVYGKAAHGSLFEEGMDANIRMGYLLNALAGYSTGLLQRTPHPLVGLPSMHASKLSGGTEWSMYAAQSTLQLERRTLPGESMESVLAEYQAILDRLSVEHPSFQAQQNLFLFREAYELLPNAEIVECLQSAATGVLGAAPPIIGKGFWMDSALLGNAGIPTVVIGPSGGGAHAAVEWVELDSVYLLVNILAQTAMDFCN
jgi:acetylornithine deacetylase